MKLVKIGELDNGFVLTMIEDETLVTFNDCTAHKYVKTMDEALAEIKDWSDKVDKAREESGKN